jgi:hypothetical protein
MLNRLRQTLLEIGQEMEDMAKLNLPSGQQNFYALVKSLGPPSTGTCLTIFACAILGAIDVAFLKKKRFSSPSFIEVLCVTFMYSSAGNTKENRPVTKHGRKMIMKFVFPASRTKV